MSRPELRFGWEKLSALLEEANLRDLIEEHFEEIAEDKEAIPLEVSWAHYLGCEERGILRVWVARGPEKSFAGYCCWFIDRHPTYRALYAWASPYYLAPEYRQGWNGYNLLTSAERELKALGVRRIVIHDKVNSPHDRIFLRAKYRPYERSFTKVLTCQVEGQADQAAPGPAPVPTFTRPQTSRPPTTIIRTSSKA